jgi:hypothetical protein
MISQPENSADPATARPVRPELHLQSAMTTDSLSSDPVRDGHDRSVGRNGGLSLHELPVYKFRSTAQSFRCSYTSSAISLQLGYNMHYKRPQIEIIFANIIQDSERHSCSSRSHFGRISSAFSDNKLGELANLAIRASAQRWRLKQTIPLQSLGRILHDLDLNLHRKFSTNLMFQFIRLSAIVANQMDRTNNSVSDRCQ